jgi:hypothetical protein
VRAREALLVCAALGVASCGLSLVGQMGSDGAPTAEGGASSTSSSSSSSSGSVPPDGAVGCDSGLGSAGVVLLAPDGGACPSGTTEQTVEADPVAQAGACACGTCIPTSDPSCAGGSFTWTWGSTSSCTPGTQDYTVPSNGCFSVFGGNTTIAAYNAWKVRAPQGGACTAPSVAFTAKVTTTAVRQCVPNSGVDVCAAIASGQRACVAADPDGGTCAGTFSVPLVVGDGATVSCEACGCTRTATACNVEYHSDSTCTNKKLERPADGLCDATGTPSIQSIKVVPLNVTCTPTPGAATASLTNARTLCCTP